MNTHARTHARRHAHMCACVLTSPFARARKCTHSCWKRCAFAQFDMSHGMHARLLVACGISSAAQ
eukprot:4356047-Pleurochrysis_carterae.AAC.1